MNVLNQANENGSEIVLKLLNYLITAEISVLFMNDYVLIL